MPYRTLEPLSKQLTIVIGLTVVGFMAFGLALSFYRNFLFEQTLLGIRTQNEDLRHTITRGFADLEYFRSAQYKDKYAKENLNKINPGEKVLIITQVSGMESVPRTVEEDAVLQEQKEAAYLEFLRQMPILEHWKLYLFYPERIEELKHEL